MTLIAFAWKWIEKNIPEKWLYAIALVIFGAGIAIAAPSYIVTPETLQEKLAKSDAKHSLDTTDLQLGMLNESKFQVEEKYYDTPKSSPAWRRYKDRLDEIKARIKQLDSAKTELLKILKDDKK